MTENIFSPTQVKDQYPEPIPEEKRFPALLKTFTIVNLIIGILGLLGILLHGVILLVVSYVHASVKPAGSSRQEQLFEVNIELLSVNLLIWGLNLFVAGTLLVGGIKTLAKNPQGPRLLSIGLLAAIGFNIFRPALRIATQLRMRHVLHEIYQPGINHEVDLSLNAGMILRIILAVVIITYYFVALMNLMNGRAQRFIATWKA